MTDITERLRGMAARDDISALTSWTIEEAADEIERLRAALLDMTMAAGWLTVATDGMESLRAERLDVLARMETARTALRGQG